MRVFKIYPAWQLGNLETIRDDLRFNLVLYPIGISDRCHFSSLAANGSLARPCAQ